ncbi:hypothetical protein Droror1_Dr00018982 [Drosera rotundifolia]
MASGGPNLECKIVNCLIKVCRTEPVMVLRVDKEKGYIDLTKRRVAEEDIINCEERYNESKLVHSIMRHVSETLTSGGPNLECRMYKAKYPEVDMAVMIQVKNIANIGAYVQLFEYNNIEGMILLSELSRCQICSFNSVNSARLALFEEIVVA